MRILIVGGTGFIGGAAALLLEAEGHEVTLGARKPAEPPSPLARFPLILGDYLDGGYSAAELRVFDAVIFGAGSDIRFVKPEWGEETQWRRANAEGVPRFFQRLKDAGVRRAVLIGSFYPQVVPHLIKTVPYIAGRHEADAGARALASESFHVCSVNAPYVVGVVPGQVVPTYAAYISYALGKLPMKRFAPAGGANFISVDSLARAIATAVTRGENGKAYLIGDQNLSYRDYLEEYFRAVGDLEPLRVLDEEHPLFPDSILYAGRGGTVMFEANAEENAFLGYGRKDIRNAIQKMVAFYRPIIEAQP